MACDSETRAKHWTTGGWGNGRCQSLGFVVHFSLFANEMEYALCACVCPPTFQPQPTTP